MNCPHCGAPNRDDARFCGVCGRATLSTEPTSSPSPGEAPAMIGREIAGRYRMLAKLGEGGMGAVFRAEQISLKRAVAVKLLRPDVLGNQMLLRRFNAEAEAVAKLNHPNTVNIYDFGQDTDGALFIAMEFIEGRSLRSVIQSEAPLPPRRALAIALQVAASLSDAHAHAVVHRDLKPDNVMLQDRGRERDVARVLDFGIAKLRDDNRATQMAMTQQGDMLGTPQYMAPEQIRAEKVDGRTDIYALGCLLYEMVTARLPHEAPTVLGLLSKHLLEHPVPPSQRRPELGLPPALDALILGAMAKDPQARPPTMDAFGEHLAAMLASLPPDPRAPRSAIGPAVQGPRADTPAAHSAYGAYGAPRYAPPSTTPVPPPASMAGGGVYPGAQMPGGPQPPYLPPAAQPPGAATPAHLPRARPPSRKAVVFTLVGMGALGVAIAVLVIADRTHSSEPSSPAPDPEPRRGVLLDAGPAIDAAGSSDDPWAPTAHDAGPSAPDPWAPSSGARMDPPAAPKLSPPSPAAPLPAGTRVAVGQGVSIIMPPGFRTEVNGIGTTLGYDTRGVVIAGGPIIVPTNDVSELAKAHARINHLVFDKLQQVPVGGTQRPMGLYHGTFNRVAIRHAAVMLVGPGYRMGVMLQAPTKLMSESKFLALASELCMQRVVLP